jgi:hypothetical protein
LFELHVEGALGMAPIVSCYEVGEMRRLEKSKEREEEEVTVMMLLVSLT